MGRVQVSAMRSEAATTLCCALLLIGNLCDGLFTLVLLQLNLAQELNPLLRWIYESSPVSFMVAKMCLVQLGMLLLWIHRHVRSAQVGLWLGAAMYAAIVSYHVAFLARLSV